MKTYFGIVLLVAFIGGFNDIAKVNDLKRKAKEAYNNGDYETALKHYEFLADSLQIEDDNIVLNLANAYFKVQDSTKAVNTYNSITTSNNKIVSSVAHQQLGIIKNSKKQFKEALSHFKESLKADPYNEDSRYNYEMLKKVLEEQEKQQQNQDQNQDQQDQENKDQEKQDQQNKDQQNQDQQKDQNKDQQEQDQNQDKKEGDQKEEQDKEGEKEEEQKEGEQSEKEKQEEKKEGEESDEENKDEQTQGQPQSFEDKLKEMKISEEKARMILEAMKNNEIQYFQNKKRKATKKKDSGKPDW